MKINAASAREYFAHPSQHVEGLKPEKLIDAGFHYYAKGPICGVFHAGPWPGVFFGHYGAKPEGWGKLKAPALACLNEAWTDLEATRLIGWTRQSNRQAVAFARRLGFVRDGSMPIPGDVLIMTGWTPWQ